MGHRVVVGGYGARLGVVVSDAELLHVLIEGLPPGWTVQADIEVAGLGWQFRASRAGGLIRVTGEGGGSGEDCADHAELQQALVYELRRFVGYHTDDYVFVHAGVVAHHDRAIVLPGISYAGKSTLVEALVRAGAAFYSDEYAVIDRAGRVVQYREGLVMRDPEGYRDTGLAAEGPQRPLPIGLLVLTEYRRDATWQPVPVSAAEGIVAMVEHTIPARDRPGDTLATLALALAGARCLRGYRGEAGVTAKLLLECASDRCQSEPAA